MHWGLDARVQKRAHLFSTQLFQAKSLRVLCQLEARGRAHDAALELFALLARNGARLRCRIADSLQHAGKNFSGWYS